MVQHVDICFPNVQTCFSNLRCCGLISGRLVPEILKLIRSLKPTHQMSTKNRSKSKADSPNMPRKSKVQSPIIKKGKKRIHGEELKVRILEPSDDWQPIPTSPKEKRRSSKYRETTKVFELQDEEMSDDVRPEVPRSRSRSRSRESSPSDFDEPETHPEVKSSRRKRVEPPPIEVVVDRTLRTDVQYRDVYPKDEHGNEDRSAPAKRWEPIPASAEQQVINICSQLILVG